MDVFTCKNCLIQNQSQIIDNIKNALTEFHNSKLKHNYVDLKPHIYEKNKIFISMKMFFLFLLSL